MRSRHNLFSAIMDAIAEKARKFFPEMPNLQPSVKHV